MKKTLLTVLCVLSFGVFAEIAVIVHPNNAAEIKPEEIAKLFLGRSKSFADGNIAIPLAQNDSAAVTAAFNEKILNKTGSQMKAYWSKLVFTGKGTPPKELSNDTEMIDFISQNPNMIGYISKSSVTSSVKVVATF